MSLESLRTEGRGARFYLPLSLYKQHEGILREDLLHKLWLSHFEFHFHALAWYVVAYHPGFPRTPAGDYLPKYRLEVEYGPLLTTQVPVRFAWVDKDGNEVLSL